MEKGEIPGISGNTYNGGYFSENDISSNFGNVKVDSLKEAIREIEEQIEERVSISGEFKKEGEKMKLDIKNFLLTNEPKGQDDSEFARERAELRKKSIEINELQLNEKVNCWRDVVNLKKDLREKQKELFEREQRIATMNKILED